MCQVYPLDAQIGQEQPELEQQMQNVSINDPEVEPVQQPVQVDSSDLILDSMINFWKT